MLYAVLRAVSEHPATDEPSALTELFIMSPELLGKEVVFLADSSRKNAVPFDIYHKPIIFYQSASPSDFAKLRTQVSERLKAVMEKRTTLVHLADVDIKETEGLTPAEFAALVFLGSRHLDSGTGMPAHDIRQYMGKAGFTDIAVSLAVRRLVQQELVDAVENPSSYGDGEPYTTYLAANKGMEWLARNQDKLIMQKRGPAPGSPPDQLDDIPF
jgi:hypothetical protein